MGKMYVMLQGALHLFLNTNRFPLLGCAFKYLDHATICPWQGCRGTFPASAASSIGKGISKEYGEIPGHSNKFTMDTTIYSGCVWAIPQDIVQCCKNTTGVIPYHNLSTSYPQEMCQNNSYHEQNASYPQV